MMRVSFFNHPTNDAWCRDHGPIFVKHDRTGEAATKAPTARGGQPQLTVWYGAMPESNGKSNFTAILMRKDGQTIEGMSNGHTIDRSEYPDRVRYEADRVRYLIGELSERPFILDYDADKHSGYVPPPVAAQPDLARDAARYRWLRDVSEPGICAFYLSVGQAFHGVKFSKTTVDDAIDAQISALLPSAAPTNREGA